MTTAKWWLSVSEKEETGILCARQEKKKEEIFDPRTSRICIKDQGSVISKKKRLMIFDSWFERKILLPVEEQQPDNLNPINQTRFSNEKFNR